MQIQEDAQQKTEQNKQQRAIYEKMKTVDQQLSRVIAFRRESDLGYPITCQIWQSRLQDQLQQALPLGRQISSRRVFRPFRLNPWIKLQPTSLSTLKGVEDSGPILYLAEDDSLWLQQSTGHPLWSLRGWYLRSGAPQSFGVTIVSLDRLHDRLESLADQLEARNQTT